jgi:hypothetical protein
MKIRGGMYHGSLPTGWVWTRRKCKRRIDASRMGVMLGDMREENDRLKRSV